MDSLNGHHTPKRPPAMGEMKRVAEAQALTLRPELRAAMRALDLSVEEVARRAKVDLATLQAFIDGAAINPRWQQKLATWIERAYDEPHHHEP
jgi:hypothetical protein